MTALIPTTTEIRRAIAEAAAEDGWVAVRSVTEAAPGGTRQSWPDEVAVMYALDAGSTVAWVDDPDGFNLEVSRPDEPPARFPARNPHRAKGRRR